MRDYKLSAETRAKMRAKALERWADPDYRDNQIAALSAAHKRADARETYRAAALLWWKNRKRNTKT